MPQDDEAFRTALIGKKIPILTLDHQWHKLFTQTGDDEEIHRLEEKLNELLKRQGKINTEIKSLNVFKKKLMQEIVSTMELADSPEKEKKMSEKKCLIEETNEKVELYKEELLELPKEIDTANFELMIRTMHVCYDKIQNNVKDIDDINQWIDSFRLELKKKALLKQKKEIWNNELYSYMHAVFGPDVIEMFDMKYNPQNVLQREDSISEQTELENKKDT